LAQQDLYLLKVIQLNRIIWKTEEVHTQLVIYVDGEKIVVIYKKYEIISLELKE